MSYSFAVRASTKDEAKTKIASQMAQVVQTQPDHKLDQAAVIAAGGAFVDLLGDVPAGQELQVSIHGSVSWYHTKGDEPHVYTSASIGVSAGFVKKVKAS